jgi:ubiquinone/menaquinone biosynthesis C-methylase UbiE
MNEAPMRWGFTTQERQAELNRYAAQFGWEAAAREYARTEHPSRFDYYYEYICSEARADFSVLTPSGPASRALDIGSGWGNITAALARIAGEVYALDSTYENLEFVRIRLEQEGLDNAFLICANALELPFAPGYFDLVVMNGVLEWVGTVPSKRSPGALQRDVLHRVYNLLKPGGSLYIGIENRWGIVYFLGRPDPHTHLRWITLLPRPLADLYSSLVRGRPYREWTYSRCSLAAMLKQAGFSQVRFVYPIPGYQNFRFLASFADLGSTDLLFSSLRAFPRFKEVFSFLFLLSRLQPTLKLLQWFYPSFGVVAARA